MEENDVSLEGICFELDQETVDLFKGKSKDKGSRRRQILQKVMKLQLHFFLPSF